MGTILRALAGAESHAGYAGMQGAFKILRLSHVQPERITRICLAFTEP